MVGVLRGVPIRTREIVVVLVAVAALVCLGGLGGAAIVMGNGQSCAGPGCDQQIAASRSLQLKAPPAPAAELLAIPLAIAIDPSLPKEHRPAMGPPHVRLVWPSLAPFAPRSPPLA